MPDIDLIQTSFSAGELSPKLLGRVDFNKYQNGAEQIQRFLPLPHGGLTKTQGTKFIAEVKNSANTTRLIRFIFSAIQAYQIEFGNQYIRFYVSEGQVQTSPGVAYEITSPYLPAELKDLQFAQSADILFLVHPNHAPRRLSRTSLTSWTLTTYDYVDGPYLDINITATTLTPSATTGAISITASASTGINSSNGFRAADVGRWIRLKQGANFGWAKVTGFVSTTVVNATVFQAFPSVAATVNWNLGAWNSVDGFPRTIAFYEDRLMFGGNEMLPQTVWGSRSGDYYTHSPTEVAGTVVDDNGLVYGLASGEVNDIRWLDASKVLTAGTASGEFVISGGGQDAALTPTNVRAYLATARGTAKILPVRIDSALIFIQKAKTKLREHSYDFGSDSFQAVDLTILSEHITASGVKEIAYQQEPYSIIWACLENGGLVTLTYSREQEITAWGRQPLGGDGLVQSVSVIPSPLETNDELWLIVKRTINGVVKQYIEKLTNEFTPTGPTDKGMCFYVDCGLTYSGALASIITGLGHLEGKEVAVFADGAVQPRRTVTAGQITLQTPAALVHVGLPYRARIKTVRYEGGNNQGTAQGKIKRVHRVGIRFLNTLGVKFGPNPEKLEVISFRQGNNPMNQSPPLFTGDQVVLFPGDYDKNGQINIISDDPTPVTILAIMPEQTVNV